MAMKRIITIALLIFSAASISAQADTSRKRVYTDDIDLTHKQNVPVVDIPLLTPYLSDHGEAICQMRCPCLGPPVYVWYGDEYLFVGIEYRVFNDRLSKGALRFYQN
jgi:hypothetical protein